MADDGSAGAQRDARITALEAALADSNQRLTERDPKIAELLDQVAKLVTQIEKLTEQLGQNSKNSHLPPSSDGPGSGSLRRTGLQERSRDGFLHSTAHVVDIRRDEGLDRIRELLECLR